MQVPILLGLHGGFHSHSSLPFFLRSCNQMYSQVRACNAAGRVRGTDVWVRAISFMHSQWDEVKLWHRFLSSLFFGAQKPSSSL